MIRKAYLSPQSRQPAGICGRRYTGRYLDRANARINQLVYATLAADPRDHVLEISPVA